jgi:hypothetical protein
VRRHRHRNIKRLQLGLPLSLRAHESPSDYFKPSSPSSDDKNGIKSMFNRRGDSGNDNEYNNHNATEDISDAHSIQNHQPSFPARSEAPSEVYSQGRHIAEPNGEENSNCSARNQLQRYAADGTVSSSTQERQQRLETRRRGPAWRTTFPRSAVGLSLNRQRRTQRNSEDQNSGIRSSVEISAHPSNRPTVTPSQNIPQSNNNSSKKLYEAAYLPRAFYKTYHEEPSVVVVNSDAGNVFKEGKITKRRKRLDETMGDSTSRKRHFTNHRILNLAGKRGRQKEDRPAAVSEHQPRSLFPIAQVPTDPTFTRSTLNYGYPSNTSTSRNTTRELPRLEIETMDENKAQVPGLPNHYTAQVPRREILFSELLKLDYNKILSEGAISNSRKHYFYIFSPPSKDVEIGVLCQWLKRCNPVCMIFLNKPGQWRHFLNSTKVGTVIIHQTSEKDIWQLSSLANVLAAPKRAVTFWRFSVQPSNETMHRPVSAFSQDGELPILTPILQNGSAILLTPSFLVSQPQMTRDFLKWFQRRPASSEPLTVVASADLVFYLYRLAYEKEDERNRLSCSPNFARLLDIRALSDADCRARYESHEISRELEEIHNVIRHDMAYDKTNRLIFADERINGNDEQSLVNWFGGWSTSNLEGIRRFYVLGSGPLDDNERRATHNIIIPQYTRETTIRGSENPTGGIMTGGAKITLRNVRDALSQSNSALEIRPRLNEIYERAKAKDVPILIFRHPVSHFGNQIEISDKFPDINRCFKRFADWFEFVRPFQGRRQSYIGLFYPLNEEWRPESEDYHDISRHPWIAVYRRANLDLPGPQTNGMELIIWDCAFRDKFPGPSYKPRYNELSHAQRSLIDLVIERSAIKNPGSWIKDVWLGGWGDASTSGFRSPLDLTMDFLKACVGNLEGTLPRSFVTMLSEGWRPIEIETMSAEHCDRVSTRQIAKAEKALFRNNGIDPQNVIFGPPGVKCLQKTRGCANHLYIDAMKTRYMNDEKYHMSYLHPSTMEWYEKQRAERQGWEHIRVAEWDAIFDCFDISTEPPPKTANPE